LQNTSSCIEQVKTTNILMREIVIDTETTGLNPLDGHRMVEIGAVELVDHSPTGGTFRSYVCPELAVPADAVAVHGLTAEFLADKPLFGDVADELLAFVGDAPLAVHAAGFDIAFLNAELKCAAQPPIATERVVDTLVLARRKHPGGTGKHCYCPDHPPPVGRFVQAARVRRQEVKGFVEQINAWAAEGLLVSGSRFGAAHAARLTNGSKKGAAEYHLSTVDILSTNFKSGHRVATGAKHLALTAPQLGPCFIEKHRALGRPPVGEPSDGTVTICNNLIIFQHGRIIGC
jgi:Exonuclease